MTLEKIRPSLNDLENRRSWTFVVSLVIGFVIMALLGGVFAAFIIPGIKPPKLLVRVMSSPHPEEVQFELPAHLPHRVAPSPTVPTVSMAPPSYAPPAMPIAPVLMTIPTMETDFLVNESDDALEAIAQFKAEEAQRLQELLEEEERSRKVAEAASLLAQEKAVEKKTQRKREEAARQLTARKAKAKRDRDRALATREREARRATIQAKAAKRAAAAKAKQVTSTPAISRHTPPNYPTSARRQGLQGTTRISATVTASGKVSAPRVTASSGHRTLDSSALAAVKKWRFTPAKNGLGQPVAYQMTIPVTFRLN